MRSTMTPRPLSKVERAAIRFVETRTRTYGRNYWANPGLPGEERDIIRAVSALLAQREREAKAKRAKAQRLKREEVRALREAADRR